ncbi:hypothetical protein GCK32_000514 [Trichostrongylus colubriformis]|uniref:Uncharacterized protein n=1 Tax=Trichostrongylus colubriformis TaxID=6319 RepID=A0AAN8FKZ3_TRICO
MESVYKGVVLSNKSFHPQCSVRLRHWPSGRTEDVEEANSPEEPKSSKNIRNAMKAEEGGGSTGKPMALDPGVEIFWGRSPGPMFWGRRGRPSGSSSTTSTY